MRYVALLKGINLGRRQVPMAELRELAKALKLENPRTYVASGNLVFGSEQAAKDIEADLEKALAERFGFAVDVVVRSAEQWRGYARGNPLEVESKASPSLVMLSVGKEAATDADVAALREKASAEEKVIRVGEIVWLYFAEGAARSKLGLGPAKGVWTTRNWRSVLAIEKMLEE